MNFGHHIRSRCITGFLGLVLMALTQWGCTSGKIRLSSDDQKFVRLYADLLLVQSNYESLPDSGMKAFFNKEDSLKAVFAIHNMKPEEYNHQLEKYKQDPFLWKEILQQTMSQLESRRRWLSEQPVKKN